MITVDSALGKIFDLITTMPTEEIPLENAAGRVLAIPVTAKRAQPPFAASAMDGYAVNGVEVESQAIFRVIGESAAGHKYEGTVNAGEAVRIFTGAPLPKGTNRVVIQEDVTVRDQLIIVSGDLDDANHVRAAGSDFSSGDQMNAPRLLGAADLALLAAMNKPRLQVYKKPIVALLATGDELVMPGENPADDQIIASNSFGLKALIEQNGGTAQILPIARDNQDSLTAAFKDAQSADLIVTIGGASVGDHDLVGKVAQDLGMKQSFYKIRMRPGKPLMAGQLSGTPMIGLPGNPVSAMVCASVFIIPAIKAMLGLPAQPTERHVAALSDPLPSNGSREHFMRAIVENGLIRVFDRQDSSLLSILAQANALAVRAPNAPEQAAGDAIEYISI